MITALHILWLIFLYGLITLGILFIIVIWVVIIFAACVTAYRFYEAYRKGAKKLEEEERLEAERLAQEEGTHNF